MESSRARLVIALKETAARLRRQDVTYRWASFAHCNCGHLAQTITGLGADEIQGRAMRREGDWAAQARARGPRGFPAFDFGDRPALDEGAWEPENVGACPLTGASLDQILDAMYGLGLTASDVGHLERLSDPVVRRRLGNNTEYFPHHRRENVVAYLEAWADLLEEGAAPDTAEECFLEAAE
jgi:hypothetical protein